MTDLFEEPIKHNVIVWLHTLHNMPNSLSETHKGQNNMLTIFQSPVRTSFFLWSRFRAFWKPPTLYVNFWLQEAIHIKHYCKLSFILYIFFCWNSVLTDRQTDWLLDTVTYTAAISAKNMFCIDLLVLDNARSESNWSQGWERGSWWQQLVFLL